MRDLTFSSDLQSDPALVRSLVLKPALFLHVAAPLVAFSRSDAPSFPEDWEPGEYRSSMKLLGLIPIGWQAIVIEFPQGEDGARILTDNGYGPLLNKWEHLIEVHAAEGGTRYVDRLRFDAGVLTPFAAIFISQFFKHRHRRMKSLDLTGFRDLIG